MTPEQQSLQEAVRRFAVAELRPLARELETRDESVSAAWMKRYAELGVLGINGALRPWHPWLLRRLGDELQLDSIGIGKDDGVRQSPQRASLTDA